MSGTQKLARKASPTNPTNPLTNLTTTNTNITINPHAHQSNISRFTQVQPQAAQPAHPVLLADSKACITTGCANAVIITKEMRERVQANPDWVLPNKCTPCWRKKKQQYEAKQHVSASTYITYTTPTTPTTPQNIHLAQLQLQLQAKQLEAAQLQAKHLETQMRIAQLQITPTPHSIQPQIQQQVQQVDQKQIVKQVMQNVSELQEHVKTIISISEPTAPQVKIQEELQKLLSTQEIHTMTPMQHHQLALLIAGQRYCKIILTGKPFCGWGASCKSFTAHPTSEQFSQLKIAHQAMIQQNNMQPQQPQAQETNLTPMQAFQLQQKKAGQAHCCWELKFGSCKKGSDCQNVASHYKPTPTTITSITPKAPKAMSPKKQDDKPDFKVLTEVSELSEVLQQTTDESKTADVTENKTPDATPTPTPIPVTEIIGERLNAHQNTQVQRIGKGRRAGKS